MEQQSLVGQDLHIIEASRSYSDTPAAKEFHGVFESTDIIWNVTLWSLPLHRAVCSLFK